MKKLTSAFRFLVPVLLVVGFLFSNVTPAFAATTGNLLPTANGFYTAWGNGDESAIDEGTASPDCSMSGPDSIITGTTGLRESVDLDETTIPNGSTVTSVAVTVSYRSESGSPNNGGTFQTFVRAGGVDTDSGANLIATGTNSNPCSHTSTQTIAISPFVKNASTDLEIGVIKTATDTSIVRVGAIQAVVTYTADTTAPVATIDLQAASDSGASNTDNTTNASSLVYDVTFTESVSTLAASDFAANPGTATGCIVGAPSGSGANYTVTVTGCSNTGTHILRLNASGVTDVAGNPNALTNGPTVTIDRVIPVITVSGSNPASSVYGTAYTDAGATTTEGTVVVSGATITASTVVGAYTINYDATDTAGNTAVQKTRTVNVIKASSTTTVTCPVFVTYTGSAQTPCTASVTGVGGLSLTPTPTYTNNTSAGTANAAYTYAGDANHNGSSDNKNFTITQASSTTLITCPVSEVYTGVAQTPCTANVTGAGGLNQSVSVVHTNNTNVGTANANATFAGDANHTGSSDAKTFAITKANAVIVVTPYSVTYDGGAHTATGTATGVIGEDLSGLLDLSGTVHTAAGSYPADAWTFAGDANYNSDAGTVSDSIVKANAVCSILGYSGTYDALSHGATGSCTGVEGELSGLDLGASFTDVPGGTANWNFANPNYSDQSGSVEIEIVALNLVGSFTADNKVYDGNNSATVLTRSLDAVIAPDDVTLDGGTATFDNANAGIGKTVTLAGATLVGTDAGNYNLVSVNTTTADITTATAICNINGYSGTYDGVAHGATGSCTGIEGELSGLDLGLSFTDVSGGSAHWDFTNSNYAHQEGNVQIEILALELTGSFTADNKVYDGNTSATVLTRSLTGVIAPDDVSLIGGTATFDDATAGAGKTVSLTGATLAGADAGNYTLGTVNTATADITKATALIVVTPYNVTYDSNSHTATGTATGANAEDLSALLDLSGTTHTASGAYPTDAWTFAGDTNYSSDAGTVSDSIGKANATIVVNDYNGVYDGVAHGTTGTATGVTAESLAGLDLGATYTNVPGGVAHWVFTDVTGNYNDAEGDANVNISKASAVISVTPYDVTYDGASHTATGTATGVLLESLAGLNLSGTTHTAAGDYPADAWTFTDVTGNYNDDAGNVNDKINLADAVCIINGYSGVYDAVAHGATGSCVGVEGTLPGLDLGASFTDAPGGTAHWTFDGGANYNDQLGDVSISISKANVDISVTGYNVAYDGASHTATGSATGVLGADLSAGLNLSLTTHTNAGTYAGDAWTFTGGTNYNDASGAVDDAITSVSLTADITVDNKVYDGNNSATILTRTLNGVALGDDATISGGTATFADVNAANGINVSATGLTLGGADAGNYTFSGNASTTANITPRPITVSVNPSQGKVFGQVDPALTYAVTDGPLVLGDSFTGSLHREAGEDVGVYIVDQGTVTAGSNYTITFFAGSFEITQSSNVITVNTHAPVSASYNSNFFVDATASSGLTVQITSSGVCSGSGTGSVSILMNSGTGVCTVHFNQGGDLNYSPASEVLENTNATKASQEITFAPLAEKTIGDPDFDVFATGGASGNPVTFTAGGDCSMADDNTVHLVAVGSCTITAHQLGNDNFQDAPDVPQTFTINDVAAPVISLEDATSPTDTTITVNWTTDHASTSRVVYDTVSHPIAGAPVNYGYAFSTIEDGALVTSHSVLVSGLSNGTAYFFRGVSHGSPESVSDEVSETTTTPEVPAQCGDQNDNDGDGLIDANDPGCHTDGNPINSQTFDINDNDETDVVVPPTSATINATKIVCDSESDLPNWGAGGPSVTASTATAFLGSHTNCHLAEWNFEWAPTGTVNPGDQMGAVGGAWTQFSGSTSVPAGSLVWVREQMNDNYIPFSGDITAPRDQDVSAEFYCSNDVLNYDNYDFINPVVAGQTYNCVGFNVLKVQPPVEDTGSITVCKVILDKDGNVVVGSSDADFSIAGFTPDPVTSQGAPAGLIGTSMFSTPLSFNKSVLEGEALDAQCVTYDDLDLGGYYYGEESIVSGDSWADPKYNDQNSVNVNTIADFFAYSGELFDGDAGNDEARNQNADGHIVLTADRPDRTLVVLNQEEESQQCESDSFESFITSDSSTLSDGNPTVELDFIHSAWTASIDGATWIWSEEPLSDPVGDTFATFTKDFTIAGTPTGATLEIAADNSYEVYVNDVLVHSDNTEQNYNLAGQDSFSISAENFVTGPNTIKFVVKNWAQENGTQATNPAGLLYKLTVTEDDCLPPPPLECPIGTHPVGDECVPNEIIVPTGSLIVHKVTIGGNGNFDFTGSGNIGEFSIETSEGSGSHQFNGLPVGNYSVTEGTLDEGWEETGNTCDEVSVANDQVANCTITNTFTEDNSGGPSGSSTGGGGGGGASGGFAGFSLPTPQVLGAATDVCSLGIDTYMRKGYKNNPDEVKILQNFLNGEMGSGLVVDGIFGSKTEASVKAFQLKYKSTIMDPWHLTAPTGIVYKTTLVQIKNLMCPKEILPVPTDLVPWSANPAQVPPKA